jgi:sugar phosphate isomerase/epimerase
MWVQRVSGFTDEISADLSAQLDGAVALGLGAVDIRSVDGINVLSLTDEQLATVRDGAHRRELAIACVGSPVNKVPLTPADRDREREKLGRALHAADVLGTDRVRIFTPEATPSHDPDAWPRVEDWMAEQVAMAKTANKILLHENDGRFWGAYPDQAQKLFQRFGGPNFRLAFDFANTVLLGYRPVEDWLGWMVPYLDTLHIKDADRASGQVVPPGQGEGRLLETFTSLAGQGWQGTLTLEPHLKAAGPYGGFSGFDLFKTATDALHLILAEVAS